MELISKDALLNQDYISIETIKEAPVIEELEKIKAEFEDKILLNQTVAIQILDNHIAELKGEQE